MNFVNKIRTALKQDTLKRKLGPVYAELKGFRMLAFVPGVLFIFCGLATVFAPKLLLPLVAVFCISLGALFLYLGWKFLSFRDQMGELLNNIKSQVIIHGVSLVDDSFEDFEEPEKKKDDTTYH